MKILADLIHQAILRVQVVALVPQEIQEVQDLVVVALEEVVINFKHLYNNLLVDKKWKNIFLYS